MLFPRKGAINGGGTDHRSLWAGKSMSHMQGRRGSDRHGPGSLSLDTLGPRMSKGSQGSHSSTASKCLLGLVITGVCHGRAGKTHLYQENP